MKGEFISLETAQKLAYNEKINELNNIIDAKDKIINEQALEIARLKEKIDKVVEYIKETGLYCDYGDLCHKDAEELFEILGDTNESNS